MTLTQFIQTINAVNDVIELNAEQPQFTVAAKRTIAGVAHEIVAFREYSQEEIQAVADSELEGLEFIPIRVVPAVWNGNQFEPLKRAIPELEPKQSVIKNLIGNK